MADHLSQDTTPKPVELPPTPAAWKRLLRRLIPTWKALNSVNNVYFLHISYVVLVAVPIIAALQHDLLSKWIHSIPLTFRLGFFSSLFLSLAHMFFQAFAPQLVRRFESPNDLYRDLLQIKSLQKQYLPDDEAFVFNIEHCRESFSSANFRAPCARAICGLLYGVGILLGLCLLLERSLIVLRAPVAA